MNFKKYQKRFFAFAIASTLMYIVYWQNGNQNTCKELPRLLKQNVAPSSNGNDSSIHVLLLAYPRSGSTFTAELLSVRPDAFYLFEPLYEFVNGRGITDENDIIAILDNIFRCHYETLEMLDSAHKGHHNINFFYRKVSSSYIKNFHNLSGICQSAKAHVIKTIRLSVKTAGQLIAENPALNVKIVHLVRDPRAMINSLKQVEGGWDDNTKHHAANCDKLRNDLMASQTIPQENYIRVRYEDIASNILDTTARVYNFLGLPLSDTLVSYISSHSHLNEEPTGGAYYGTHRGKKFNPNQWLETLTAKQIKEIESSCKDVIEHLGYDLHENA